VPDQAPLAADSHIIMLTANTAQVEGQGAQTDNKKGGFRAHATASLHGLYFHNASHNDIAHVGAKARTCVEIHVSEFIDTAVASQENISNPKPHAHVKL
jgi:hypothetical protein